MTEAVANLAEGAAADAVLRVESLSVHLAAEGGAQAAVQGGARMLLQDVSFTLQRRSVLGIVGESGSGKSVLARSLCNWVEAPLVARGAVHFGGRDILNLPAREMRGVWGRRIAYIGADPSRCFDPTLPIGEQIVEKLRSVEPGVSREAAVRRVTRLLDDVRIPDAAGRFDDLPHRFSGGMIQRAAIVDALITDPEVLIADSITQPLDVTVAAQIIALLQALRERFHTAIVFVSPSLAVVKDISDDVLLLSAGRTGARERISRLVAAPGASPAHDLLARSARVWSQATVHDAPAAAASPGVPLLTVHDLHRHYALGARGFGRRVVQAVRGVSFEVRRGETFGIVGESGCGKSTLSRLLIGLEKPDAGRIGFHGIAAAQLQLVLPDPFQSLPAHWSVGRIIAEPLRIHQRLSKAAERERVLATMAEVGLPAAWYERLPGGLSGGQRQRISLARALVLEPALLILDETFSALAPDDQHQLCERLVALQRERQLTTLIISHDLALVRRLCERIAVMYLGRIVELGANRPTFFEPLHPYTRALLSALPVMEANPFERARFLLDGETPSPIDLPEGCSYAARCPAVMARCREADPVFQAVGGRGAACHRLDDAAGRATPASRPAPDAVEARGADPPSSAARRAPPPDH